MHTSKPYECNGRASALCYTLGLWLYIPDWLMSHKLFYSHSNFIVMLYPQLNDTSKHAEVKDILGLHDGNLYQNTLDLMKQFKKEPVFPKDVLEHLGLTEKYKVRFAGGEAKRKRMELTALLKHPRTMALVREYMNAAKNPKNTLKVRFNKKGEKVWLQMGMYAYSETVAKTIIPKGEVMDGFKELPDKLDDEVTEEEQSQVIFVDEVAPAKQQPKKTRGYRKKAAKK